MKHTPIPMALLLVVGVGCRELEEASTEDAQSLQARVEPAVPVHLPANVWMPDARGLRWRTRFQSKAAGKSGDSLDREEDIVATGPRKRGATTAFGYVASSLDGKSSREEWYVDTKDGRCLAEAGGGADRLALDPPLLVLPAVARPGATIPWSGTIRFGGKDSPAVGYTRFRGLEPIATSEGSRDAACVETVLLAGTSGPEEFKLPMIRWFLPKVGPVRVWFKSGNTEYLRETTAFRAR